MDDEKVLKRTPVLPPKNVCYLRVSTHDQDIEKSKDSVLRFVNDRKFGPVRFVEEKVSGMVHWRKRRIAEIIDELKDGDRIIIPELTRLGRSTLECLEILKEAKERGIACYCVKENLELNSDGVQAKILATMLSLFAELERDFISMRTKEALKARKKAGVKLGRPKGPGKSKLDPFKDEITSMLKVGVTKVKVAKKYNVYISTLNNWLEKNEIKI